MNSCLRQPLLVVLLAAAFSVGATRAVAVVEATDWLYRAWQTEDGLPDNNITGVAQSMDGYMWVATTGGLMRFNGADFTEIPMNKLEGVPSRAVRFMFRDRRDRLWLGMERGPLICLEQNHVRAFTAADGLLNQRVVAMAEDREGAIWVAYSSSALRRIKEGIVTSVVMPQELLNSGNVWLTSDVRGELWFAKGTRLGVFRDGALRPLLTLNEPASEICASAKSGIWICAGGRLLKYEEGQEPVEHGRLPGKTVPTCGFEDHFGALWIGTFADGLLRLQGDHLEKIATSHQEITSLTEDREGNLWAGTAGGGLNLIRPRAVELIGRPAGLPVESVLSVDEDMQGWIWAAAQDGELARGRNGQWELMSAATNWPGGNATCVATDQQGGVWVGTSDRGLNYFRDGIWRILRQKDGLASDAVRSLLIATNGDVWLATANYPIRLQRLRDGRWQVLDNPGRIGAIRALAESVDGTIWVGTAEGQILRVSGLALVNEPAIKEPGGVSVRSLLATPDGSLWIGYAGDGVGRLKAGKYTRLTTANGLADNFVSQMLTDETGELWITGNRGLSRIHLAELAAVMDGQAERVRARAYGRSDGLPVLQPNRDNCPAACRASDGRLWFAMRSGLLVVQPKNIRYNPAPPPVNLERVSVDDQVVAQYESQSLSGPPSGTNVLDLHDPHVTLPVAPGHRKLEFEFAALSFSSPENVQFRYRLTGFDQKWIEAGTRRKAIYPHLSAGSYEFRVLACNNEGVWNQTGTTLKLAVSPFFWETWWFKIGVGLGTVVMAGGSVFFLSRHRYRQKLRRLEAKRALEQERTRIAKDIHDDLGASLTRITLLSQPTQNGRELTGGATASLGQIHSTARQLTRSMEEVVWAVNPEHDTFDGLANYLSNYAQGFLRLAGVRCRLEMPMQLPSQPLSAEVRHNLFLAFKESLNNVVKHAAATEVRISLTPENTRFVLLVEDNGKGFAPTSDSSEGLENDSPRRIPGNGLTNMRSRLQEIGGTCELKSTSGAGSKVKFTVPLKPSHDLC